MNNPAISVIVPVYNVEAYLPRCIESILSQSFTNFEVLLIDDGSIDNSGKICDDYAGKDSRIRVFHKENEGVAVARQLGTDEAKGVYSIHADGDDWMEPEMLQRMYSSITKQKADMLICDFYRERIKGCEYERQCLCSMSSVKVLKDIIEGRLFGALWNKMVRHSLYRVYNIKFVSNISYCEDVLLLAQLLQHKIDLVYLNESFYHYNTTNCHSITRNYTLKTYVEQKKYIDELSRLLPQSFSTSIDYAMFNFKCEAFHHNILSEDDFYNYHSLTFFQILRRPLNFKMKICMLLSSMGFYRVVSILHNSLQKYN